MTKSGEFAAAALGDIPLGDLNYILQEILYISNSKLLVRDVEKKKSELLFFWLLHNKTSNLQINPKENGNNPAKVIFDKKK